MTVPTSAQPFPFGMPNIGMQPEAGRYVNTVAIGASQWDIAVDLFQQFALPGTPVPQVVQQIVCRTVMSPMHAKAFAHVLQVAVDSWEEKFGALPSIDILIPQPPQEGETPHA